MDSRIRNVIIIGVVAIVAVVGYFVLTSGSKQISLSCDLQDKEPQPVGNSEKLKPLIDSKNGLALAKIEGYLKYRVEPNINKTYLPLDVHQLRYFKTVAPELRFGGGDECVTIHMGLHDSTPGVTVVDSMYIDLYKPVGDSTSCFINAKIDPLAQNKKHYRCSKRQTFECTARRKDAAGKDVTVTIADLVITYLEVELDGDNSQISQGKFSTEPFDCANTVFIK